MSVAPTYAMPMQVVAGALQQPQGYQPAYVQPAFGQPGAQVLMYNPQLVPPAKGRLASLFGRGSRGTRPVVVSAPAAVTTIR